MNFLGVDTSAEYLTVIAQKGENRTARFITDCSRAHSVRLMDEIDGALRELGMKPADCDFFAVVVGAGSFTGIRIGISCVKGLCLAAGKPALAITSFDTLAYAEKDGKLLCTVNAGHGCVYAAVYENRELTVPPRFCTEEEAEALISAGYRRIDAYAVDPVKGFFEAVANKCANVSSSEELTALYLRKSSAEENANKGN